MKDSFVSKYMYKWFNMYSNTHNILRNIHLNRVAMQIVDYKEQLFHFILNKRTYKKIKNWLSKTDSASILNVNKIGDVFHVNKPFEYKESIPIIYF
jgi:hypothetical protein